MVAVLDKPKVKLKRRFRTRHVDDKSRTTASRSGIKIPIPTTDGSIFQIEFLAVPKEKDVFQTAYCAYEFNEDAILPANLKDENLRGMKVYDFLKQHDDFTCGTIYEDLTFYADQKSQNKEALAKELAEIDEQLAKKKAELAGLDKKTNKGEIGNGTQK